MDTDTAQCNARKTAHICEAFGWKLNCRHSGGFESRVHFRPGVQVAMVPPGGAIVSAHTANLSPPHLLLHHSVKTARYPKANHILRLPILILKKKKNVAVYK